MVVDDFEAVLQEQVQALSEEMSERERLQRALLRWQRVAEEAIRLLSPGQLAQLRSTLDDLEKAGEPPAGSVT